MVNREDIVNAARTYVGLRFKKGGRDQGGIDCVGLLTLVARDVGIVVEDRTDYTFSPEKEKFVETVYGQSDPAPLKSPKSGQITILRQSAYPMHVGILVMGPNPSIINANLKARRVVEQDYKEWADMLIELREFKGVV